VGPGGAGKTRLAINFAHQRLAGGDPPEIQLYAQLGPTDPAAALATLLGLLGVEHGQLPPELTGRAALYRDRLAGRPALILLDDATSAAQVRPLLPAGPAAVVLVTSRRSLALDGVRVLPLRRFPPAEAERLLARIAGAPRVAADPAGTARLLALCGHLPLAVSMAARRLRARPAWQPSDLVDRLSRAPDLLRELAAGTGQLREVFDRSYQSLVPGDRELLAGLGALPDQRLTGELVARCVGLSAPEARRRLDRLADESLLEPVAGGDYRMPELLRHYLRTRPPVDHEVWHPFPRRS
jgi:hypothetical protein